MKVLKKAFLPLFGLGLLASCSDNNMDSPNSPAEPQAGDFYVSLKINHATGTRTGNGDQGVEEGKDYENAITSALLIFTGANDNNVIAAAELPTGNLQASGVKGQYVASFSMLRAELKEATKTINSYRLYVIANPTSDIIAKYVDSNNATLSTKKGKDMQESFTLTQDLTTYWNEDNFLMSNASHPETRTINASDVEDGKHTTASDPLQLGEVTVERSMSRFDLALDDMVFSSEKENSDLDEDITITFDGFALVNQAKTANIFKVGGTKDGFTNWLKSPQVAEGWSLFNSENWVNAPTTGITNQAYVITPNQTSFINPLFTALTGDNVQKNFQSDFTYDSFGSSDNKEDNTFTYPKKTSSYSGKDYYIWRYAMENTIAPETADGKDETSSQTKAYTTAIIFRAKMEGEVFTNASNANVYAYNNTVIGTEEALEEYKVEDGDFSDFSGEEKNIAIKYAAAIKDNTEGSGTGGVGKKYETLEEALVANGFAIYTPDNSGNYYCYYVYYNRHDDNGENGNMGIMEFATVRNNVYKLAVTKLMTLGHPPVPGNDPDPEDPDDPDETDKIYCEMTVTVLPWEVRINDIEF